MVNTTKIVYQFSTTTLIKEINQIYIKTTAGFPVTTQQKNLAGNSTVFIFKKICFLSLLQLTQIYFNTLVMFSLVLRNLFHIF